jgi:hypothetical protein
VENNYALTLAGKLLDGMAGSQGMEVVVGKRDEELIIFMLS